MTSPARPLIAWLEILLGLLPATLACAAGIVWLPIFIWQQASDPLREGFTLEVVGLVAAFVVVFAIAAPGLLTLLRRHWAIARRRPAPDLSPGARLGLKALIVVLLLGFVLNARDHGWSSELVPVAIVFALPALLAMRALRETAPS